MASGDYIAYRSNVGGGDTLSVDVPSEASPGDRLLLIAKTQADDIISGISDFTAVDENDLGGTDGDGRSYLYTAVVTSGGDLDPGATVALTFSSNTPATVAIVAFEACDILDFQQAMAGTGSQSSIQTPSVSVLGPSTIAHIAGDISNVNGSTDGTAVTWTADASTTEVVDVGGTVADQGGSARLSTILVATESVSTPGASAARTHVPSRAVRGRGYSVLLGTAVARPTANAGSNQTVSSDATVNLDGTASDGGGAGGPYTYQWTQTSGTPVTLNDDTAEDPSFTAPSVSATLVFQLVVTDSASVASEPDSVTITVVGPEDTALPDSDVSVAGWTPSTGSTSWGVLSDETDSTYTTSPTDPSGESIRVGLSPLTEADGADTVTLTVRASAQDASSASCTIELIEGASTVIASSGPHAISGSTVERFDLVLSEAEINSITDFADLDVQVTVTAAA